MTLTDEIKELYRIEDNPKLEGKHYLMHGVLEGIRQNPSVNDEDISGVIDVLSGEVGFFDVRKEKDRRNYFVVYVDELPHLVLDDSHTYSEESLDIPIYLIERINFEEDILCLKEIETDPLLVRDIARLLNHCLGEALELIEQEEL